MNARSGTHRPLLNAKRTFDILLSAVALLVLFPFFLLIALLIKLDNRGPVFYIDKRVGKRGSHFNVYKFRTMVVEAAKMGLGRATATADPRITRVGRLLRDYSLDELPQLVNVLKAEMSIVGPRPTIPAQVAQYTAYERKRLQMKPGLTGWAQINGRNALTWEQRIELDIWYVEHWSFLLDLWIVLKTPLVLLRREGLYGPEGVTLDFKGH